MEESSRPGPWRRPVAVAGVIVVVVGVAVGLISVASAEPVDPVLGHVALASMVAAPGAVALLGLCRREGLWLPAGVAASILAFFSFAGLTLPLLPAAVVFLAAWIRHPARHTGYRVHLGVVTPLVVVLLLGAAAALLVRESASWRDASGGGGGGEVVSVEGALLSIVCTAVAVVGAWLLTRSAPNKNSGNAELGAT